MGDKEVKSNRAWREECESLRANVAFLHKRRGELVIKRDRYKAALAEYPEGRDVMLGGALAEVERLRAEIAVDRAEAQVQTQHVDSLRTDRENLMSALAAARALLREVYPYIMVWKLPSDTNDRIRAALGDEP